MLVTLDDSCGKIVDAILDGMPKRACWVNVSARLYEGAKRGDRGTGLRIKPTGSGVLTVKDILPTL
jgi:hypothetical protein